MGKYLRSIALAFDDSCKALFRDEPYSPNLISEAYEQQLTKYPTNGISKVIVQIAATGDTSPRELLDVLTVTVATPVEKLAAEGSSERRAWLCSAVYQALFDVAEARGWPPKPLADAHTYVRNLPDALEAAYGKRVRGPRFDAQMRYRLAKHLTVFVDFFERSSKDKVATVAFAEFGGTLGALSLISDKLFWCGPSTVEVAHKNGADKWLISVNPERVDFVSARAALGDAHGLYDLGIAYLDGHRGVMADRERARSCFEEALKKGYTRAQSALDDLAAGRAPSKN